jgi:hypothetical protein
VLIRNSTLQTVQLQKVTFKNGTLHNGILQIGTFQNVKVLENGTCSKQYITKRDSYIKMVHVTKWYVTKRCNIIMDWLGLKPKLT